jgi:hypothetical protein
MLMSGDGWPGCLPMGVVGLFVGPTVAGGAAKLMELF